ncbi:hypothetical protein METBISCDRAFT_26112 [Metschnikowia bicuspidata]|uniref:Protein OCA4 n=1 Tax=Metschnikowia bicuspidata TaxID=27322 RepID=A0A4P9ZIU9_9ASCO|nr:hypothetical protein METBISCDRAFT_26112 [Metschnikowia bicuspidata]
MLIPPDNFGVVQKGVYRCSKLEGDHLPFLETLKLKLLIFLDVAKPPRTLKTFLEENKVDVYNLGGLKISNHPSTESSLDLPADKSVHGGEKCAVGPEYSEIRSVLFHIDKAKKNDLWMIIEKNLIVTAFEVLLDKTKHGVLLVDSTLALVGILRKMEKWNINSIINEYRTFTANSSKICYNVEVFLECLQIELVPYEADSKQEDIDFASSKSQLGLQPSILRNCFSLDEGLTMGDDEDVLSIEDYEDDMDEDLLSASPQIPANLLKLVDQRKFDDFSPCYSPDTRKGSVCGSRNSSVDAAYASTNRQIRISSVDSRHFQARNNRFLDLQFQNSFSPRRPSFETSIRHFKMERALGEDLRKERHKYYLPLSSKRDNFGVIKCRLPPEHKLADWFIRGRDFWEHRQQTLQPQ